MKERDLTYGLIGRGLELVDLFALRLFSLPAPCVCLAASTRLLESVLNLADTLESLSLLYAALERNRRSFAEA